MPAFLEAFRNTCNVRAACQVAGIGRHTAYDAKNAHPEFAALWDEAEQEAVDVLEAKARQMAMAEDTTMMIFLLKAHRPLKYRETVRQEHVGEGGGPVQINVVYGDRD